MVTKDTIEQAFKSIQDEICSALETLDGKAKFQEDLWERPGGGGGRTRVIADGNLLQKGGVNFSAVFGELPPPLVKELGASTDEFFATGVSIVLHPFSPRVPIIHMNIRYFEMGDLWWFGGGIDLTPHYVSPELASQFHAGLKAVCDKHHADFYPRFKKWADDYFYIKHRDETRGIGGIFFDKLNKDLTKEELFAFVCDVGRCFSTLYSQQAEATRDLAFGPDEKQWQLIRRGRYVEFNLVYDRGTKFGLETSGRIESILMSLPTEASWHYNFHPEANSAEAETLNWLKKDIDWIQSVPSES